MRTPAQYARASAPASSPRATRKARTRPPAMASSATAARRSGSRRREISRPAARRRTPARRWSGLGRWRRSPDSAGLRCYSTPPASRPGTPVYTPRMAEGHVIVIGGAEDKGRERVILNRFIALAGGPDARVAVISTASALGTAAGELYRRVFTELGCREVRSVHAMTRAQANDDSGARVVREATGLFLNGGHPLRP